MNAGKWRLAAGWLSVVILLPGVAVARHREAKTITTPDGRPIRKVVIHATGLPGQTPAVAAQVNRDTCLTVVSADSQADAAVDVGMALPSVAPDATAGSDIFASAPHDQTMGKPARTGVSASASATCTDDKGGGCNGTYAPAPGNLAATTGPAWVKNTAPGVDISLASIGSAVQELWEPDAKSKHSWSDQLRVAAGCPECPGSRFNARRDGSYRAWIAARCPAAMADIQ
jgi:hypothetical protein